MGINLSGLFSPNEIVVEEPYRRYHLSCWVYPKPCLRLDAGNLFFITVEPSFENVNLTKETTSYLTYFKTLLNLLQRGFFAIVAVCKDVMLAVSPISSPNAATCRPIHLPDSSVR